MMDEQKTADLLACLTRLGIRGPGGQNLTAGMVAELLRVLAPVTRPHQDPGDLSGSPLFATAIGLHEFFRVLTAAGFTESQSLRFLAYASQSGQPPQS
jgi:hypothetical protein